MTTGGLRGHPFASRDRLVFAHRGGAKLAPENTLVAFENGMALGSDGFECDVHLSRDGVPVVIHDATLDRTTDSSGPVAHRTASELASVDAGYRFAPERDYPFRGKGHGVPALEEVLRRTGGCPVIIELKQGDPELARAVHDVLRRTDSIVRVCVGSFHQMGLDVLRALAPAVLTSASEIEARWTLYRSWVRWPIARTRPYVAFQVPERAGRLQVISPPFLAQAHRNGARVDVWVIDNPADVARLFDAGVDGVISDRPDLAVPARDSWGRAHL
jgi:glycerophosphoryl diester phosphodiesterase